MKPMDVIVDCDTGVDDAMALLLALRSPKLNVRGITTVAGNARLDNVVNNTLVVVDHAQKQVPVYRGAHQPLLGSWETAEDAHGGDGLGDLGFPRPKGHEQAEHAVDFLVRTYMESPDPITLVTLAPLTNVALALSKEPTLASRIPSLIMMAGGIDSGNVTPAAEFNIWVDPEAAELVFHSGIPMTMVGLDPIYQGGKLFRADLDRIAAVQAPWCEMFSRLLRWNIERWEHFLGKERPATPPDLLAMGLTIDPDLGQGDMHHVTVECIGKYTRGMTVVDRRWFAGMRPGTPKPNVNVIKGADNDGYRRLVVDTLTAL